MLKRKPILKSFDQPDNIENLKVGSIDKERWSIVYKAKENEVVTNCMFFLKDEHLYSTTALNQILAREESNKTNLAIDTKCVSDMIK